MQVRLLLAHEMLVIAAVDRTEAGPAVVTEAETLANALGAELRVVHVLDRQTFNKLERDSVENTGRTVELDVIRDVAKTIADEAVEEADADAITVGQVGKPAEELLKYADREGADYVVVGGRRRSAVGKALFGSVTQEVLLGTDLPVLTVPERESKRA